jgi:hypothetical protein
VESRIADLEVHEQRMALLQRQLEAERTVAKEGLEEANEHKKMSGEFDQKCADLLRAIEEDLERSTQQFVTQRKDLEAQIQ